jgi:hypothetical protein
VAKTLVATLDWKMDIQAAIALPNRGSRGGPTEIEKGGTRRSGSEAMGHVGVDMTSELASGAPPPAGKRRRPAPRRRGRDRYPLPRSSREPKGRELKIFAIAAASPHHAARWPAGAAAPSRSRAAEMEMVIKDTVGEQLARRAKTVPCITPLALRPRRPSRRAKVRFFRGSSFGFISRAGDPGRGRVGEGRQAHAHHPRRWPTARRRRRDPPGATLLVRLIVGADAHTPEAASQVTSSSFKDGGPIPAVLLLRDVCHDPDVPSRGDDVNGKSCRASA